MDAHVVLHGQDIAYAELDGPGPLLCWSTASVSAGAPGTPSSRPCRRPMPTCCVDLPGTAAPQGRGDYSLGALRPLRDLLDHLGGALVFVGHSLGGGIAMQFATSTPTAVNGLVLVPSGGLGPEASLLLRAASLPGAGSVLAAGRAPRRSRASPRRPVVLARVPATRGLSEEALSTLRELGDVEPAAAFLATLRGVVDASGQRVSALSKLCWPRDLPTCSSGATATRSSRSSTAARPCCSCPAGGVPGRRARALPARPAAVRGPAARARGPGRGDAALARPGLPPAGAIGLAWFTYTDPRRCIPRRRRGFVLSGAVERVTRRGGQVRTPVRTCARIARVAAGGMRRSGDGLNVPLASRRVGGQGAVPEPPPPHDPDVRPCWVHVGAAPEPGTIHAWMRDDVTGRWRALVVVWLPAEVVPPGAVSAGRLRVSEGPGPAPVALTSRRTSRPTSRPTTRTAPGDQAGPGSSAGGASRPGSRRSRSSGRRSRWRGRPRRAGRAAPPRPAGRRPGRPAPAGRAPARHRQAGGSSSYQPTTSEAFVISSCRAADRSVRRSAVVALPQVEHRVGGEPEPGDAGDQAGHVRQRHRLGAALGEVAAERVVQPARRGRGALGASSAAPAARVPGARQRTAHAELDGAAQIPRAVGVRLRQRPAQRRPPHRAARTAARRRGSPRSRCATSSTRSSPTRQPTGSMMLNRITSVSVNAAWPAANEIAAGATPAKRTASGSSTQSTVGVRADQQQRARRRRRTRRPCRAAAQRVLPGVQGVGAQHRQRAEHDPERVLHAGQVGDEDGQAEPDRAAHAVVQPDRVRLDVCRRAFLGGRQRAGQPGGLAAEQPSTRCAARRRRSGRCSRRSARPRSSAPARGSSGPAR